MAEHTFTQEIIRLQTEKIERMKLCKTLYTMDVLGKEIVVFPRVFSPATDTRLLIETLLQRDFIRDTDVVLELCAGTGIISLFLAEKAKKVVATDIHPDAVENIKENCRRHNQEGKLSAFNTDLFPNAEQRFDVIVVNPPYTDHIATDI